MTMLADEYAIQRTISSYALLTGRGDWDPVLALYTPEGAWEIPHLNLCFVGREALRGALAGLSDDLEYVLQHNSPAVIDVAGDEAQARSAIREAGKRKGADEAFEFFGIYADTLVRTPAGWKFARRVFEGIGTQYWPLLPAG
jgi:ketosteroid isomerase-like protein